MPLYKHDPNRMTPELRGISMQVGARVRVRVKG